MRGVEDRVAALAVGLRAVHRDVGVAHHVGRRGSCSASAMPIEAATTNSRPSRWNGVRQRLLDALGDHGRLAGVADVVEQERELVAAEPRDGVAGAQDGLQPPRDGDQQRVADVVAERVVDELEAVEVQEEHGGERPVRARGAGRAGSPGRGGRGTARGWAARSARRGARRAGGAARPRWRSVTSVREPTTRVARPCGRAPRCRARASSGRRRRGAGSGARTRSAGWRR